MSVKRIRKIDPVQCGKVTAILSVALILIIFVPFMLIFSMAGLGSSSEFMPIFGGGLLMIILMPILYGIFGFIIGLLYAYLYNVTYRLHGGLQMEYDDFDDDIRQLGSNI